MQGGRCIATKIAVPEMRAVDSSSVEAIGYDPGRRELHVRFRDSGETYVYYGVEERIFEAFRAAESKGRFLNTRIKRRYLSRKLSSDRPDIAT